MQSVLLSFSLSKIPADSISLKIGGFWESYIFRKKITSREINKIGQSTRAGISSAPSILGKGSSSSIHSYECAGGKKKGSDLFWWLNPPKISVSCPSFRACSCQMATRGKVYPWNRLPPAARAACHLWAWWSFPPWAQKLRQGGRVGHICGHIRLQIHKCLCFL